MSEPAQVSWVEDVVISSWHDAKAWATQLAEKRFIFRGQREARWSLSSTLERRLPVNKRRRAVERELMVSFLRSAPLYLRPHGVPEDDDELAWLGLMQHHGAPTRLLDFTKSPYVAFYFAFEEPPPRNEEAAGSQPCCAKAAVWAADVEAIRETMVPVMRRLPGVCDDAQARELQVFGQRQLAKQFLRMVEPPPGMLVAEPWKPDVRQISQRAVFLFPTTVDLPFAVVAERLTGDRGPLFKRLILPASLRLDALRELAFMNVTAASLFPGLDGLARSLAVEGELHAEGPPTR